MSRFFASLMLAVILAVAGCSPVYTTDYEFVAPQTDAGKACANQCLGAQDSCRQDCRAEARTCEQTAKLEGHAAYIAYVAAQTATGNPIEKEATDFTNMAKCSSAQCESNCAESFRICHINCGGQVIPHRYCTSFCD